MIFVLMKLFYLHILVDCRTKSVTLVSVNAQHLTSSFPINCQSTLYRTAGLGGEL